MTYAWQPTASITTLKKRAEILTNIRSFFSNRKVLEVETPLLSHCTVTDPHLASFSTRYATADHNTQTLYLQTSPEFAMKRLLAIGIGPIYQITRAFRNQGEKGRWHNPEFSILEWYRPGFTLNQLMDETESLLQLILPCPKAQRMSYRELFVKNTKLDPHQSTLEELKSALINLNVNSRDIDWLTEYDTGLQLILDVLIRDRVDPHCPLFLYHFPASQSALARIKPGTPSLAERFEVYYKGLELGNAFHELSDPVEQKKRFMNDLNIRKKQGLPIVPFDQRLIDALEHQLPDCSGIAMGIDRLVALAIQSHDISAVMSFALESA